MGDFSVSMMENTADIVGESISRPQMASLVAKATNPLVFERCDFKGEDFSRLNMVYCCRNDYSPT